MVSVAPGKTPARLGAAQRLLASGSLDALVVTDLLNVRHLCGFTGSNGLLVVLPDRQVFVTDSRYTLQAREEGLAVEEVVEASELDPAAGRLLSEAGVQAVGVEERSLPVSRWQKLGELLPGVDRLDVSDALDTIRRSKDGDEIRALREAARLAEEALRRVLPLAKVGVTEAEFSIAYQMEALKLGADSLSLTRSWPAGRGALCPTRSLAPAASRTATSWSLILGCGSEATAPTRL